jgi:hypothetical protein
MHLLVDRSFHSGDLCEPFDAHDARSTLNVGMSAAKATDAPIDKEAQAAKRAIKRFNDPTLLAGEVGGLLPQAQDIDLSQYFMFDKACDRALLGKSISQVHVHINSSEKFFRKDVTSTASGSVDRASGHADSAAPSAAAPSAAPTTVAPAALSAAPSARYAARR